MKKKVICVKNIKKKYRLGAIGGGTLSGDIQSWIARKTGKEDPNAVIGTDIYTKNKEFWALKGISFDVYKGEAIGIIGTNGAGKSTLLKILSRVTAPTEGEICYDGRLTSMLEVGTGFHGELTGRENIYLNGAILGMNRKQIDEKIHEIIEFSEVGEFIDTPVKRYSSGMYVKLAFSVAAHLDSEIMIMDEILAVGDAAFQKKCLDRMRMLADTGERTILYVSHNMSTIRRLCSRCIVLDHGQLLYDGSIEDGIKMYMSMSNALEKSENLDKFVRQHNHLTQKVKFMSVQLLNEASVEMGTKIHLKVCLKHINTIASLAFRIVVHTNDGIVVGMTMSENLEVIGMGNYGTYEVEFDTRILAPGSYLLDLVACNPNDFGDNEVYDIVGGVIAWNVLASKGQNHSIAWSNINWGFAAFPKLEVKLNKK